MTTWAYRHDINQMLWREVYHGAKSAEEFLEELKKRDYVVLEFVEVDDLTKFSGGKETFPARLAKLRQTGFSINSDI